MRNQLLKTFLHLLLVLFCVSLLSFFLANISSVKPEEAIARRIYSNPTQQQIQEIRIEKGLDRPIAIQYLNWVENCLCGNLGISYQTSKPVVHELGKKITATFSLVGMSLVWIILFTIPLGILSAIHKNSIADHIIRAITIIGISIPTFWLGFMFLTAFAISLHIFKVVDYGNFRSIILPSITMAIPVICSLVRILRSILLENLKKDYVVYAQARGLSKSNILYNHVLKNSLPPMVTLFFQNVGMMIGSSAIVESVFSWPGLGEHFVKSIINRDLPVVTACVLVLGLIFVISNTLGEVLNKLLNPKMAKGEVVTDVR